MAVEFPVLRRAHLQVDALNRQALASVVYVKEFGIGGYGPKFTLVLELYCYPS